MSLVVETGVLGQSGEGVGVSAASVPRLWRVKSWTVFTRGTLQRSRPLFSRVNWLFTPSPTFFPLETWIDLIEEFLRLQDLVSLLHRSASPDGFESGTTFFNFWPEKVGSWSMHPRLSFPIYVCCINWQSLSIHYQAASQHAAHDCASVPMNSVWVVRHSQFTKAKETSWFWRRWWSSSAYPRRFLWRGRLCVNLVDLSSRKQRLCICQSAQKEERTYVTKLDLASLEAKMCKRYGRWQTRFPGHSACIEKLTARLV